MDFKNLLTVQIILVTVVLNLTGCDSSKEQKVSNKSGRITHKADTVWYQKLGEQFQLSISKVMCANRDSEVACLFQLNDSMFVIPTDALLTQSSFLENMLLPISTNKNREKEFIVTNHDDAPFTTDFISQRDTLILFIRDDRVRSVNFMHLTGDAVSLSPYINLGMSVRDLFGAFGLEMAGFSNMDDCYFFIVHQNQFRDVDTDSIKQLDSRGVYEYLLTFENKHLQSIIASHYSLLGEYLRGMPINYEAFDEH